MIALSPQTVEDRIRRRLFHRGETLRKSRSAKAIEQMGRYFIVETWTNALVASHCTLEGLAHELRVLRRNETVGAMQESHAL